jgi:hypothetical protein
MLLPPVLLLLPLCRMSMFLMPTFVLVVLLNQIDRHNISYAALTMNRQARVCLAAAHVYCLRSCFPHSSGQKAV